MVKPTTKLPGDPLPPRATTPEDGALPPSLSRWESSSLPVVERVASARVATLRTLAESLAVKFAAAFLGIVSIIAILKLATGA